MPTFMDHHPMPQLPPEATHAMRERITNKQSDDFGVTPLNVFAGVEGNAFCLSDAADKDAIVKAHAALGVSITTQDVEQVHSLA